MSRASAPRARSDCGALALEQRLQPLPDGIDDHGLCAAGGMDAVRLEVSRILGKAFEHERDVRELFHPGDVRERSLELFGVCRAVVGWQTHAYQQHLGIRAPACI